MQVREPNFLSSPRVSPSVLASRATVTLPKGLDDKEHTAALTLALTLTPTPNP